ncbi:MAG: hypothetical protein ACI9V1_003423 [Spirosomataceae bacterium]|jgi:hypothetical protein
MKRQQLNILVTGLFIGMLLVFYFFDPTNFSVFPSCYFKKFTGFDCPGCGGQRALHDLLHLRFADAIDHNLLMMAGSPVIGFVILNAFFFEKKKYFTSRFLWMTCAVAVTFWIVRNLPIEALEWLKAG